jgi:hypothetical protein
MRNFTMRTSNSWHFCIKYYQIFFSARGQTPGLRHTRQMLYYSTTPQPLLLGILTEAIKDTPRSQVWCLMLIIPACRKCGQEDCKLEVCLKKQTTKTE